MIRLSHALCRAVPAALVLALGGCSGLGGLVGTQIEVEAGQRSLEEQVLGSYEHLGEEVYVMAGVRAIDPISGNPSPPRPMTESEARALAARRRMEFNRDDVLRFRGEGYVGEGNDGLLMAFEDELARLEENDPRRARLVREVVQEENEDRLVVMRRIVDTNPDLRGPEGMAVVGRILAARQRDEADKGVRLQLPDGTWAVKGGGP